MTCLLLSIPSWFSKELHTHFLLSFLKNPVLLGVFDVHHKHSEAWEGRKKKKSSGIYKNQTYNVLDLLPLGNKDMLQEQPLTFFFFKWTNKQTTQLPFPVYFLWGTTTLNFPSQPMWFKWGFRDSGLANYSTIYTRPIVWPKPRHLVSPGISELLEKCLFSVLQLAEVDGILVKSYLWLSFLTNGKSMPTKLLHD